MPLTRTTLAQKLVTQVGGFLSAVGLPTTADSTNTALMDAGMLALSYVGVTPVDPLALSDTDLAAIPNSKVLLYLTYARWQALMLMLGHANAIDQQVGTHEIVKSTTASALMAAIRQAKEELAAVPGSIFSASPSSGQMVTGTMPNDPRDLIDTLSDPRDWPYPTP